MAAHSRGQGGAGVDPWGTPSGGAAQTRGQGGAGGDPWGTPSEGGHIASRARGQGGAGVDHLGALAHCIESGVRVGGKGLQAPEGRTGEALGFEGCNQQGRQPGSSDAQQSHCVEDRESRHAMWIPAHAGPWKRPGTVGSGISCADVHLYICAEIALCNLSGSCVHRSLMLQNLESRYSRYSRQ
jgi:hypothetical protein